MCGIWELSHSADIKALTVVDGRGDLAEYGPHYSRRTPGSRTFTGVGQEIVLVSQCGRAVWACVYQRTPARRGTGASRGRQGDMDQKSKWLWRNMMFRNLGCALSSDLIKSAVVETKIRWTARYGELPAEKLRTEIDITKVTSSNPGYCYMMAGWTYDRTVGKKKYFYEP